MQLEGTLTETVQCTELTTLKLSDGDYIFEKGSHRSSQGAIYISKELKRKRTNG